MAYFINSLYCNFHAMNDIDIFINKTHKKMKFKKNFTGKPDLNKNNA